MERDELRRLGYEMSEAIAPGWERRRPQIETVASPVRQWMLRELAPEPGDTVLELAAGAGDTGFEAAGVVGEDGLVISTDFSPAMVEVARRRAGELGVRNVDHRVMDAEALDLEDDSVDGVLCRFGYMLMADPATALAETRRVLRAGGRLALAVWGHPDRNPFFAVTARFLVDGGHIPPPEPGSPGVFSMASPERTGSLLEGAGFGTVRTEEVPVVFDVPDVDEYLGLTSDTAGAIAMALRRLPDPDREALKTVLDQAFAPFAGDGGYQVPGVALCAVAS